MLTTLQIERVASVVSQLLNFKIRQVESNFYRTDGQ